MKGIVMNFIIVLVLMFVSGGNVFAQEFPVTVTVGSVSRSISPFIWGVSYNGYHTFTTAEQIISRFDTPSRLKSVGIKMFRYPGGCPSDDYDWKNNKMIGRRMPTPNTNFLSIDEMLKLTDFLQAEPLYTININYLNASNPCGDTPVYPGLSPDENKNRLIQDAVDLVERYKGRIKYYELGNEQYLTGFTPDEYKAIAIPIAQAMKVKDPTIQIGIISFFDNSADHLGLKESRPQLWTTMIKSIVNSSCGSVPCFDYVSTHEYFWAKHTPVSISYSPLLKYKYGFDNSALDYSPKKLVVTEWNTGNCWERVKFGNPTVAWGMFYGEMLLTMAEKGVSIATYHEFMDGSPCSLVRQGVTKPTKFTMAEDVFSLSSVLAGGKILNTTVDGPMQNVGYYSSEEKKDIYKDVPYVTAHSGYSPDGKVLYVFLFNHHETQNAKVSVDLSTVGSFVQGMIKVDRLNASTFGDDHYVISSEMIQAINPLVVDVSKNSIVRLTIAPRPVLCSSLSISSPVISVGKTVTITANSNTAVNHFSLLFYNLDNLYGPGNPKPIIFETNQYTIQKESTNPTKSVSFTINYADIDKPDINYNNKKPATVQINGYFIDPITGKRSLPDVRCVVQLKVLLPNIGDYNLDRKVDLVDFSIWKTKYLAGQMTLVEFGVWKVAYLGK